MATGKHSPQDPALLLAQKLGAIVCPDCAGGGEVIDYEELGRRKRAFLKDSERRRSLREAIDALPEKPLATCPKCSGYGHLCRACTKPLPDEIKGALCAECEERTCTEERNEC